MARILKNHTASALQLTDQSPAILIPAAGQQDLEEFWAPWQIAASTDLIEAIGLGTSSYELNDGSSNLSVSSAINLVRGIEQSYPLGAGGELVVAAPGITAAAATDGAPRANEWANLPITLTKDAWVTVWSKTGTATFTQALFHLKTNKVRFRVTCDGVVLLDFNLDDLLKNLKMDDTEFELREYEGKRWSYRPSIPLEVSTELKFEMQATESGERVKYAVSVWGQK